MSKPFHPKVDEITYYCLSDSQKAYVQVIEGTSIKILRKINNGPYHLVQIRNPGNNGYVLLDHHNTCRARFKCMMETSVLNRLEKM